MASRIAALLLITTVFRPGNLLTGARRGARQKHLHGLINLQASDPRIGWNVDPHVLAQQILSSLLSNNKQALTLLDGVRSGLIGCKRSHVEARQITRHADLYLAEGLRPSAPAPRQSGLATLCTRLLKPGPRLSPAGWLAGAE